MFAGLMFVQWLAGIAAALLVTPVSWSGAASTIDNNLWAAVLIGGTLSGFPIFLAIKRPGHTSTRYVIAVSQMMMSSMLIHLTGGRIETHFHIFGSLAFLSFYRDWRILVPATIVVTADHIIRGMLWPQSIYGVDAVESLRWLEHSTWVIFEDIFLYFAIQRSVHEMWNLATTSDDRHLKDELEARVAARTEQLAESNLNLETEVAYRSRLYAESEIIAKIVHGVATTKRLADLLELIHQTVGSLVYAENCFVALYNPKTSVLDLQLFVDKCDLPHTSMELGSGLAAYVFRLGQPLLVTVSEIEDLIESGDVEMVGTPPAVWLGIPLRTPNGIIGVLVVQHYDDPDAYGERDVIFLTSVGDQIGIAIDRKRVEEDLRISEEQHRLLFEANPHPGFIYDLDTFAFLAVNKAAGRHYGYTHDEFVNEITATDLRCPEDVPDFLERVSKVLPDGDRVSVPARHQKKDGTVLNVEITSHAMRFAGKRAEIILVNDVTERKRTETESRVISEVIQGVARTSNLDELFELTQQSISQAVYAENFFVALFDKNSGQLQIPFKADKFDDISPAAKHGRGLSGYVFQQGVPMLLRKNDICSLLDLGKVEIIGTPAATWLGIPLRTPTENIGILVLQHYDDENAYSERDVDLLLSVADQIALAIQRKRAVDVLQESEERFRDLFDNAPVAYHELDVEGRFSRINHTEELLLGYTDAELRGRHEREIILENDPEEAITGKPVGDMSLEAIERTFIRKDGIHVSVLKEDRLIYDADGAVTGIRTTLQDITARKALEDKIQRGRKMESIGQLAAGIAHEINTPTQYVGDNMRFLKSSFADLNSVLEKSVEMTDLCKQNGLLPDKVREMLETFESADIEYLSEEVPKAFRQAMDGVERISKIVQSMKDFAHPGSSEKQATDLNKAIESTITVASNEWKYVAEVVTDYDRTLPPVNCMIDELNQVVLNIIVNAAHAISESIGDATNGKGTITITTAIIDGWAEIRISDTGAGIPEDLVKRIFDPFFTTKEVGKGTGQGLAISHTVIVDKHNGTIDVESQVGVGTTFIIRLPVNDENPLGNGTPLIGRSNDQATGIAASIE